MLILVGTVQYYNAVYVFNGLEMLEEILLLFVIDFFTSEEQASGL